MKANNEWMVLKDDELWSDRLYDEQECVEHISEEVERLGISKDRFAYRPMTVKEIEKYY